MGGWPGSVSGRTHTASTGTYAMAHFLDVVLQLEPPIIPIVRRPLPPHHFHIAFLPDFSSRQTHEDRT